MMKAMLGEHFCTNLVLYNTMACMHHLLEIISSMCFFVCCGESVFLLLLSSLGYGGKGLVVACRCRDCALSLSSCRSRPHRLVPQLHWPMFLLGSSKSHPSIVIPNAVTLWHYRANACFGSTARPSAHASSSLYKLGNNPKEGTT